MTSAPLRCPKCGTILPPLQEVLICPACGYGFAHSNRSSRDDWNAWGWMFFWVILITPAALTFATGNYRENLSAFPSIPLVGSCIAAVFCAAWSSSRSSYNTLVRILLILLLIGPYFCLSFFLCFVGCTARAVLE